MYEFLQAYSFSSYTEYYVVKEREDTKVKEAFAPENMSSPLRFFNSIFFRANKEKATQVFIEEFDGTFTLSFIINNEKKGFLTQPISIIWAIEKVLYGLIKREGSCICSITDFEKT